MRSPHTNSIKGQKQKAKFIKHLPFESATTLAEAKYLAQDRAETYRYTYRAKALLTGNAAVKVGEVIYLAGLAQGMSGYWTVLSITHIFGSGNAKYQIEVNLGADVLGQSDPATSTDFLTVRDLEAELANQALTPATSALINYSLAPTEGVIEEYQPYSESIKNVLPDYKTTAPLTDPYKDDVPNFSTVRRTISWRAI